MTRSRRGAATPVRAEDVLGATENTLLDLLDHLLNQGVVVQGEIVLGVAGVDLVYLRLNALLCAADRVLVPGVPRGTAQVRQTMAGTFAAELSSRVLSAGGPAKRRRRR